MIDQEPWAVCFDQQCGFVAAVFRRLPLTSIGQATARLPSSKDAIPRARRGLS